MQNYRSFGFIAVFLIAVTLASFLGFKLYVDYQVKKKVDVVIQSLWSIAKVSYEHVDVGLDGRVTLASVVVEPFEIDDKITIQSVELYVPDLEFLLDPESALTAGHIPEEAMLTISGIQVDISGELLALTKQNIVAHEGSDGLCLSDDAKYAILGELGYNQLRMNMSVGYTFDEHSSVIHFVIKGNDEGLAEYDFELDIKFPSVRDMSVGKFGGLRLLKGRLNYVDEGYHQKVLAYCPTKLGLTKAQFLNKKVRQSGVAGISGLVLGGGLQSAYRDFLQVDGRVNIAINPVAAVNPVDIVFYTPEEIIDTLGLAVVVNDVSVRDLSVSIERVSDAETSKEAAGQDVAPFLASMPSFKSLASKVLGGEPLERPATLAKNKQKELVVRYKPINVKNLSKYQGKAVRVLTITDFERSGRLGEVVDGEIVVTWAVGRGEMAANIPITRIKEVDLIVWE